MRRLRPDFLLSDKALIEAVGVIVADDWDDQGNPMVFALSTYEEEKYILDCSSPAGRRLRGLVNRKVRVTGRLYCDKNDSVHIRATKFRIE
jgi:hypothetical protein